MSSENIKPALFGQKYSNRDYTKQKTWGKNQFNSSFPASLVAYMSHMGLKPVYVCLNKKLEINHKYISGKELYGLDPTSDNLYYGFETNFAPFDKYFIGIKKTETIDLVLSSLQDGRTPLHGLEIKLTALPDETTKNRNEEKQSCEIVVRSPTICYIACSICEHYNKSEKHKQKLRTLLSGVPNIDHWENINDVGPYYKLIREAIMNVMSDMVLYQTPIMIQPVWKTNPQTMQLTDDCLDVFVWSNIAVIKMCTDSSIKVSRKKDGTVKYNISRFQRTVIWLYRMLFDYVTYGGVFDYGKITSTMAYGSKTDKAFAASGTCTHQFLKSVELTHPRISKDEIKRIIIGGGQKYLKPERRFDAMIVNTPNLFVEDNR